MINTKNTIIMPVMDAAVYKDKLYSIKLVDTTFGYYLVPIKNGVTELGFWAPFRKCTVLKN